MKVEDIVSIPFFVVYAALILVGVTVLIVHVAAISITQEAAIALNKVMGNNKE